MNIVSVIRLVRVIQVVQVVQVVRVVRIISLDDMHSENIWFSEENSAVFCRPETAIS